MKCCIVKDLLPGYIDGLTSEETNEEVETLRENARKMRDAGNKAIGIIADLNTVNPLSIKGQKRQFRLFMIRPIPPIFLR